MSQRRIELSTDIDAPPARVWTILTDFAAMPAWNPFIKSISGKMTQGDRLSVRIAPPGKTGMNFRPTVLVVQPERELRWRGHLLLPGIFDGEHYFMLASLGESQTRFKQGEDFSGMLVSLFPGILEATEKGFGLMNAALKQRAESGETA